MADVPLTVAVISTIAPVVAGAIPVIVGWIRESGQDKRERAERADAARLRIEREKRGACVKLLRLARDFRVLVENTCDSTGSDLAAYAQQVRQSAADITGQADEVGFMVLATEATANSLAAEACILADTIAAAKNTALGASLLSPNFAKFDRSLNKFKAVAQGAFGYVAVFTAEDVENGNAERSELQAAVGGGQESSGLGFRQSSAVPGQFQG
jgi:hypothetical protein